jgi:hypothetical protein
MTAFQMVRAKLFAEKTGHIETARVFHGFIQQNALPDVLLDVADYEHVHQGPGIVLLAHAAHYALDESEGELGVLHARRRDSDGTRRERFERVLRNTRLLATKVEAETSGALRVSGSRLRFEIADKLHAPNDDATFDGVREDLLRAVEAVFGKSPSALVRRGDARGPLSIDVSL